MLNSLWFSDTFLLKLKGETNGLLIFGNTPKNRVKPFFSQKKILRQVCFKVHYYRSADFFGEVNVLNVYD